MAFTKQAKVSLTHLSSATISNDGTLRFEKTASGSRSYFDGPGKIDVSALLKAVASDYDISSNPSDFIFEAARAVTAEVPNENGDAFPRQELLRYDHKLKTPIFATFVGKPHHINHKADNPKTARGVVLAAHYHDEEPALESCPSCGTRTAGVEDRDEAGIACKKCGSIVKDEYVELLLAVDTKKDPTFAQAVKIGSLDGLSMGCTAGYTDCSICSNRARSVTQFCTHIKSGNKKKQYKTASGMKMAYERCGDVVFTEISRVDQPADPTARQREILTVKNASLEQETKALIAAALVNKYKKIAQMVPPLPADPGAAPNMALDESKQQALDALEGIEESMPELHKDLESEMNGLGTIENYVDKMNNNLSGPKSEAEVGMSSAGPMTPTGGGMGTIRGHIVDRLKELTASKTGKQMIFAKAYKTINAAVTTAGNLSVSTPNGRLFVIKPDTKPANKEAAIALTKEVLTSIATDGLIETANKYNAVLSPKIAQVLEFHIEDFAGGRDDGNDPITSGGEKLNDKGEKLSKPKTSLLDGHQDNMDGKLDKPMDSILDGNEADMADKPSGMKNLTDNEGSDMREKREKMPKSTLEDVQVDHGMAPNKKRAADESPSPRPTPPQHGEEDAEFAKLKTPPPPAGPAVDPDLAEAFGKALDKPGSPGSHRVLAGPDDMGTMMASMQASCDKMAEGDPMKSMMADFLKAAQELLEKSKGSADESKKEAAKHASRLERLYKSRFEDLKAKGNAKIAALEKEVSDKLKTKFVRAMKLAAKRQALNLEQSPVKVAMFDTLTSEFDIDADSVYPGMDETTASVVIERTASTSFDEFAVKLIDRAEKFAGMSEEAFGELEADVQNLMPTSVVASAKRPAKEEASATARRAAVDGNLHLAPSTSSDTITDVSNKGNNRVTIREALGTTRVASSGLKNFKKD